MKKKIQKYLSGNDKGFSLVELIIVIAIMAILIGIIGLAVIPYINKSKESKDKQTVDTVYSAFQTTLADQKVTSSTTVTITTSGATGATAAFLTSMAAALNCSTAADMGKVYDKLETDTAKTAAKITCEYNSTTGEIKVTAGTIASSNKS